jgi:hypothetical protein
MMAGKPGWQESQNNQNGRAAMMAGKPGWQESQNNQNGRAAMMAGKPGWQESLDAGEDIQNGRPATMARKPVCEGQGSQMAEQNDWITLNYYLFTQVSISC